MGSARAWLPVAPASDPPSGPPAQGIGWPALLFLLSGAAGLVYQVLWQRELGLLFGNTTQATATTLAVFFLGLATGSWWLGRRSVAWRNPLRAFGWLELGIALSAALVFALLPLYRLVFAPLYDVLGGQSPAFLLAKFVLAAIVLGLPAFFMGGTLPVLAELAARRGRGFARGGVLLYAVNTAGAMAGAFAAGFLLPKLLGYRGAYGVAMLLSVLVGVLALVLARVDDRGGGTAPTPPATARVERSLLGFAALSGFGALALEVLWTRMIALAFQNSVYTYAAIVAVFLGALVVGAAIARLLAARTTDGRTALGVLLVLAGLAVAASPFVFRALVSEPGAVGRGEAWIDYVLANLGVLALCIAPPAVALGTVFPFLMRVEELRHGEEAAGARLGRLLAFNTGGALLGAVAGGFLLPTFVGLWGAVALCAGLYLLGAAWSGGAAALRAAGVVAAAAVAGLAWASADEARAWNSRKGERVLAVYEGAAGTLLVVDRKGDLKLKLNNSYTLGGTSEPRWEQYQTHIPMALHPDPKRAFFLGMGTGITAGAALAHDVKRVRVAEIVPEVVEAARVHFAPWCGGLFTDPRVDIVVEDARTVLLGSRETYDVVVGDLFLPWRRGTALLYTEEQFRAVKERLAPGGVFCQWLPLYQLGEEGFRGVARTFIEVFPDATLWRGDFFSRRPIVALVGRASSSPWNGEATARAWERLEKAGAVKEDGSASAVPFLLYAGRLDYVQAELRRTPAITDDRPWLEWQAPVAQRERAARRRRPFAGRALADFQRQLLRVDKDPFLADLDASRKRMVEGGLHLYDLATVGRREHERRGKALQGYIRSVPGEIRPAIERWVR